MSTAKNILIISSQTAASTVGSGASSFCLQRLGINTIILPTTLFGQHPGWGTPGGGVIPEGQLSDMWDAIVQRDISFDGVLCGYMAEPEHIALAIKIIKHIKTASPDAVIMVDPVMGDNGKLYIDADIASEIIYKLVPIADYITPNMWEFSVIANKEMTSTQQIFAAAKALPTSVLITSFSLKTTIGALLVDNNEAYLVQHERLESVPHGGGDSLAGLMLAHIISGQKPAKAMALATASIFDIFKGYRAESDNGEIPLMRLQESIINAPALKLQKLKQPAKE